MTGAKGQGSEKAGRHLPGVARPSPAKTCLGLFPWPLSLVQAETAAAMEKQRAKDCCSIEDYWKSISFQLRLHT